MYEFVVKTRKRSPKQRHARRVCIGVVELRSRCQQNVKTDIKMDSYGGGRHSLPVRPIIRERAIDVKKLPECIIDEPLIKPVIKATDLRALFGHDNPTKRLRHRKKENYKFDDVQNHDIQFRYEETLEHRVIEVPGENLVVKLPLGGVCYRIEHQGFEYLLYLDADTGSLKFFEKRFL